MKIKKSTLITIFSIIIYVSIILLFFQESLPFSDANSIFNYVINSVENFKFDFGFLAFLPYASENLFMSLLAFILSPFMEKSSFVITTTIITFLITVKTSNKIFKYNGFTSKFALIISNLSVIIFLFIPVGILGLINTQSSFLALQLAYGINTLFRPRIYFAGFHWVYIPASGIIIFFQKTINFFKRLKFTLTQLIVSSFLILFALFSLSYIGKINNLLISSVNTTVSLSITLSISIFLLLINSFFYFLTSKKLYLNLSVISLISFFIAFMSAKTSNRLLITLIFYDFTTIISYLLLIFKKRSYISKI